MISVVISVSKVVIIFFELQGKRHNTSLFRQIKS